MYRKHPNHTYGRNRNKSASNRAIICPASTKNWGRGALAPLPPCPPFPTSLVYGVENALVKVAPSFFAKVRLAKKSPLIWHNTEIVYYCVLLWLINKLIKGHLLRFRFQNQANARSVYLKVLLYHILVFRFITSTDTCFVLTRLISVAQKNWVKNWLIRLNLKKNWADFQNEQYHVKWWLNIENYRSVSWTIGCTNFLVFQALQEI